MSQRFPESNVIVSQPTIIGTKNKKQQQITTKSTLLLPHWPVAAVHGKYFALLTVTTTATSSGKRQAARICDQQRGREERHRLSAAVSDLCVDLRRARFLVVSRQAAGVLRWCQWDSLETDQLWDQPRHLFLTQRIS